MLRLLRIIIIQKACELGLEDCILTARNYFKDWMNEKSVNLIPKKLRPIVYCSAIKHGGKLEWKFLFEQYKSEMNWHSKNDLRFGLACSYELWQISTYLSMQLKEKYTMEKDCITGLRYAMVGSSLMTWNFVKENWDILFKK